MKLPKGQKSRTVAVPQRLLDDLAAHLAEFPSFGPVFTTEVGEQLSYRL